MSEMLLPRVGFSDGQLTGDDIRKVTKTIGELNSVFEDAEAFSRISPGKIVYEVQSYLPVPEHTSGGLFFGVTFIHPGKVGDEYFMTKGHFHKIEDRAEFYWCIEGEGALILMDKNENTRAEKMFPGSLHYINGHTAHRTANTGNSILSFGACWPADAGHNYEIILQKGFSKILVDRNGKPVLINRRTVTAHK